MGNVANVLVGATGAAYAAPIGSVLPTGVTVSLDGAFLDLGFISTDGVTEQLDEQMKEVTAWGGVRSVQTQTKQVLTIKFALIETSIPALSTFYGAENVNQWNGDVSLPAKIEVRQAWVLDIVDGSDMMRVVAPDGMITARDVVTYRSSTPIGYGFTITCYADANGNRLYKWRT